MKKNFEIGSVLKKVSYGSRIHPARDWLRLLALALALVLASAAWNLWLLKDVERGVAPADEQAAESFDAEPIESVRAIFNARSEEAARYRGEYRFVDPSR